MNEEQKDHLAVRIKHRDQCPYEKGHDDGDALAGFMFGLVLSSAIWLLILGVTLHK
jgi:hypothetical protein